jgi:hypothetical protein
MSSQDTILENIQNALQLALDGNHNAVTQIEVFAKRVYPFPISHFEECWRDELKHIQNEIIQELKNIYELVTFSCELRRRYFLDQYFNGRTWQDVSSKDISNVTRDFNQKAIVSLLNSSIIAQTDGLKLISILESAIGMKGRIQGEELELKSISLSLQGGAQPDYFQLANLLVFSIYKAFLDSIDVLCGSCIIGKEGMLRVSEMISVRNYLDFLQQFPNLSLDRSRIQEEQSKIKRKLKDYFASNFRVLDLLKLNTPDSAAAENP